MFPPSTAVEAGVAATVAWDVACVTGVGVAAGPTVGAGVVLLVQAAAARTAIASTKPNFFLMSSPSVCRDSQVGGCGVGRRRGLLRPRWNATIRVAAFSLV
jgi:hypothetical protein